ncbi:hypothetical protein NG831_06905 [Xanthomonas sacchari]|uniref:hypothetical protein n=1 Tax=Xanthomonas sacchari TaxID=56458 RepID=UPI00224C7F75|nr:hypothetical protein [Xanthomonas sacchari]MCW0411231.1 hypothetical protein [Xanthomonas sacchari]UYK67883.1 hypothetical protein NG831_06905 [Xanthomonas sacchari]
MTDLKPPSISIAEIGACLERSGYMLESRVVRLLDAAGYFVEPNQVVRDRFTGKSREIDFVSEYYYHDASTNDCYATTFVVGEVVNNLYPFVLLTERPNTPNADTESYIKWFTTPEGMFYEKPIDFYEGRNPKKEHLFSQYCVLTKKKDQSRDWMAHHPDDVYHSLLKMAEYIESDMTSWEERRDVLTEKYKRAIFWHPMLVLGGDLFVARAHEDGTLAIDPARNGFLEFNWHFGEDRRTTVIEVVTYSALLDRMNSLADLDASVRQQIHKSYADGAP